jgi:hypothetical protein
LIQFSFIHQHKAKTICPLQNCVYEVRVHKMPPY